MHNTKTKKIAFLDRDGVVNADLGYVHSVKKFNLCKGFVKGAKYLLSQNYELVIITNQAGIARGYYTQEDFIQFSNWIYSFLKKMGVTISSTYYCPHHPDFTGGCDCRKPKPQMIIDALNCYRVSPNDCLLIGDKNSEIYKQINKHEIGWVFSWDEEEEIIKFLNKLPDKELIEKLGIRSREISENFFSENEILSQIKNEIIEL